MKSFCCLFLLAFLLLSVPPAGAVELPAVVAALEAPFKAGADRKKAIYDMQGQFSQEAHLASLDRVQRGRGQVAMKFARSDAGRTSQTKFRWEYAQPTAQVIVSDGETMWVYLPENRQVIESKLDSGQDSRADDPLIFLTGLGNLARDFQIAWASPDRDTQGNPILELIPRRPSTLIARLRIVVDRAAVAASGKVFPLLSTTVIDPAGNSTRIEFSDIRVNRGLTDQHFRFTIPPGVEVVHPTGQEMGF